MQCVIEFAFEFAGDNVGIDSILINRPEREGEPILKPQSLRRKLPGPCHFQTAWKLRPLLPWSIMRAKVTIGMVLLSFVG
jgi:hypothetical protein